MYVRKFLPASFALAALLAGCTPATPPAAPDTRDADAKAIRQTESDWAQAWAAKDADKIVSFYADDASFFPIGMPVVTGKANILALDKTFQADKNFSLTWPPSDKVVVSKSGDLAYTQGSNTVTYTDPKTKKVISGKGKFVEVHEGGRR